VAAQASRNVTCSTPFGITEVGIARDRANRAGRSGAQRLSASQRWASYEGLLGFQTSGLCSTPFGITEVGIRRGFLRRLDSVLLCSTPFGITEVGMPVRLVEMPCGFMCSTPFGITEVGIAVDRIPHGPLA